jgi:hypothetical protein
MLYGTCVRGKRYPLSCAQCRKYNFYFESRYKSFTYSDDVRRYMYSSCMSRLRLRLIPSPHLLVLAIIERRVPALIATSGSHWLK